MSIPIDLYVLETKYRDPNYNLDPTVKIDVLALARELFDTRAELSRVLDAARMLFNALHAAANDIAQDQVSSVGEEHIANVLRECAWLDEETP